MDKEWPVLLYAACLFIFVLFNFLESLNRLFRGKMQMLTNRDGLVLL